MHLGGAELIIVFVIVILLFGVSRIGRLGRELGTGVREFKSGLNGDGESDPKADAH
jgi:sec-independent protein translocase protein TatA